jgi:hypothetical protein
MEATVSVPPRPEMSVIVAALVDLVVINTIRQIELDDGEEDVADSSS